MELQLFFYLLIFLVFQIDNITPLFVHQKIVLAPYALFEIFS